MTDNQELRLTPSEASLISKALHRYAHEQVFDEDAAAIHALAERVVRSAL